MSAGAYSKGGRSGDIIHVTTLDWDGPGSLKEALTTKGPRTIVFDVSGEIDATSQGNYEDLLVGSDYSNLTIAGQTAPTGGITIKTSFIIFRNIDDVIVRYIRFRNTNTFVSSDPIWFQGGHNVIFDHCTFSHGNDEAGDFSYSLGTMGNVTIQNCFFQDSKTGVILGIDSTYFTSTQFPLVGVEYDIRPAIDSYSYVLSDVGANRTLNADGTINTYLDDKDSSDIYRIQNDTFTSYEVDNFTYLPLAEVPYPSVPRNTRGSGFYVSNTHIPETWFRANVPSGQNQSSISPSGYTWIEEYMNQVDKL